MRVLSWEKEYREMKEESANWEQMYHELLAKYRSRKEKYRTNNEEWA